MRAALRRAMTGVLALTLVTATPSQLYAQDAAPPPPGYAPPPPDAATFAPQQLDQMLAPIALYPDPLLGQVLMAATYPLEIVEAARWLQNPANAALRGDQLAAALDQQPWDPSVKSLVPFPQIVRLMDSRLDWTQQLGDAFLAQQGDVMDSVQRLRQQAQAAGTLAAIPHEQVASDGQYITIQPADPQIVYVPIYNPAYVYGAWPYPDYPPLYFPPPPGYAMVSGIGFGIGVGIIGSFWGWDRWNWRDRRLHIDRDRFERIEREPGRRAPERVVGDTWQHDPAHRRGVPYRDATARTRFQGAGSVPDSRRDFRGFGQSAAPPARPPSPRSQAAAPVQPPAPPSAGQTRPPTQSRLPPPPAAQPRSPVQPRVAPQQAIIQPRSAPVFDPAARGADIRAQAARGQASRQALTPQAPAPRAAAPVAPRAAPAAPPAGGGRGRNEDNRR